MTRARAFVAAIPQRVWAAVAGLALVASLAIAAVIGAGLSVWRSAVGSSAEPPVATIEPPGSGLVVLPGGHPPRVPPAQRHAPAVPPAATRTTVTAVPAIALVVPASTSTGGTSTGFTPHLLPGTGGTGGVFRPLVADTGTPDATSTPASHGEATSKATHVRNETRAAHRHVVKPHQPKHARAKHHAKHAESRGRD